MKGKVIIIGAGNIGVALRGELAKAGYEVIAQATRRKVFFHGKRDVEFGRIASQDDVFGALEPVVQEADAVMLAIPNANKGKDELAYIEHFPNHHIVTCAKAAHAYQYPEILALNRPIGTRAMVGGGTDMLEVLRRRQLQDEELCIYAVNNGTFNFIWSSVSRPAVLSRQRWKTRNTSSTPSRITTIHSTF